MTLGRALAVSLLAHGLFLWSDPALLLPQKNQPLFARLHPARSIPAATPASVPIPRRTMPGSVPASASAAPARAPEVTAYATASPHIASALRSNRPAPDTSSAAAVQTEPLAFTEAAMLDAGSLRHYRLALAAALSTHWHYPQEAQAAGRMGTVVVELERSPHGLWQTAVVASSGHADLDATAQGMVEAAARATGLPAFLAHRSWRIRQSIVFALE